MVAPSVEKAKEWGDHLSTSYAARRAPEERFLWSEAKLEPSNGLSELPVVPYGHEATDEEIGW